MLTSLLSTWRKNCKMEARDTLPEWVTMLSFVLILKACKIRQGITDNAKARWQWGSREKLLLFKNSASMCLFLYNKLLWIKPL